MRVPVPFRAPVTVPRHRTYAGHSSGTRFYPIIFYQAILYIDRTEYGIAGRVRCRSRSDGTGRLGRSKGVALVLTRRRFLLTATACGCLPIAVAPARAGDEGYGFEAWLGDLRVEASAKGIRAATLDAAFKDVKPIPKVIELDHRQPEGTMTFRQYLEKVVNKIRIEQGRKKFAEYRGLLTDVADRYRVQPQFILALWGIESDFGAGSGGFSVIGALATLAWTSNRQNFFRAELIAALKILDQGAIPVAEMRGSWAGAMGQSQFMPSTYLAHAVDYAGHGQADIWRKPADVFASIANYLANLGWDRTLGWGEAVIVPDGFDSSLIATKALKPVADWQALGVRTPAGEALHFPRTEAALVQPGGGEGPTYLTYGNYRALLKWNRSNYFATAVSCLADRIVG